MKAITLLGFLAFAILILAVAGTPLVAATTLLSGIPL
jgi:hypothetical protein